MYGTIQTEVTTVRNQKPQAHPATMTSQSNGDIAAVLDRVIGMPSAIHDDNGENESEFLPSSEFAGSRAGYVFRTDRLGTGYYRDAPSTDASSRPETKRIKLDHDDDDDQQQDVASKPRTVRFDSTKDTAHAIPPRQPTGRELLALAEQQQQQQQTPRRLLDPRSPKSIRSACASLQKTLSENTVQRARHPDDPREFLSSEVRLHDEIVAFRDLAVHLPSYETMVRCGAVGTLLAASSHENVDVAASVFEVLAELLDPALLEERTPTKDADEDEEASLQKRVYNLGLLAEAFFRGGGLEALSANLGRLDESVREEAEGVEDILTLLEALLDLERAGVLRDLPTQSDRESTSIVASICETKLLSWLFRRIETNNHVDDDATASAPISPAVIRLHASKVLATILQHEDYSMKRCGTRLASCPEYTSIFDESDEKPRADDAANQKNSADGTNDDKSKVDGMEILLLSVAAYRKSDPQVEVECEFLENVFDALAASLLREDNVADFVEKEGIELMLRCIREKVHSGGGALKVLNFALSGSAPEAWPEKNAESHRPRDPNHVYKRACQAFVHAGGLKLLFPLYMARKSAIPSPAACSEGGSELARKAAGKSVGDARSKRAKRAARARKKWIAEAEENAIYIVYALTRHIDEESKYDSYSRLLAKFVEEECVSDFLYRSMHRHCSFHFFFDESF
ncbi:hypothetical protein ACHAWX_004921 [Stephanocyclus meneghinianus]